MGDELDDWAAGGGGSGTPLADAHASAPRDDLDAWASGADASAAAGAGEPYTEIETRGRHRHRLVMPTTQITAGAGAYEDAPTAPPIEVPPPARPERNKTFPHVDPSEGEGARFRNAAFAATPLGAPIQAARALGGAVGIGDGVDLPSGDDVARQYRRWMGDLGPGDAPVEGRMTSGGEAFGNSLIDAATLGIAQPAPDRRESVAAGQAQHPGFSGAGSVVGSLVGGSVIPGGGGATPLARIGRSAAIGAGVGGLNAATHSDAPVLSGDFARDVGGGAVIGGTIGGGLAAGGELLSAAPGYLREVANRNRVGASGVRAQAQMRDVMAQPGGIQRFGEDVRRSGISTGLTSSGSATERAATIAEQAGDRMGQISDEITAAGQPSNLAATAAPVEAEVVGTPTGIGRYMAANENGPAPRAGTRGISTPWLRDAQYEEVAVAPASQGVPAAAGAYRSTARQAGRVSVEPILQHLDEVASNAGRVPGGTAAADAARALREDFARFEGEGLTFADAHRARQYLDADINWSQNVPGARFAAINGERPAVRRLLAQQMESAIGDVRPDLVPQWRDASRAYQVARTVMRANGVNELRDASNRFVSLTDYIAGATGAEGGGIPGGLGAAAANRLLRGRERAIAATGAETLEGIMRAIHQTPQMLGRFAQPLMEAGERGGQSLAATHWVLMQREPEYRQQIEQMQSGDAAQQESPDVIPQR